MKMTKTENRGGKMLLESYGAVLRIIGNDGARDRTGWAPEPGPHLRKGLDVTRCSQWYLCPAHPPNTQ